MADFDEELKRQAAISSLLTRDDSGDSYAASMAPEVIQPDTQADYHKLINQAFDTKTDEPTWHVGDAREEETQHPIASDQPEGPPKLAPTPIVPGLVTDPESGSRYVKDPTVESGVVPYAEPATPADEAAFKPGDVTLPKSTILGPAPRAKLIDPDPDRNYLNQADKPVPGFVESSKNAIVNPAAGVTPPTKDLSGTTGFAVADPDPVNPDYKTPLSPSDELKFQAWVKANKIPFDDSATSDYDMRGFWKAAQEGDPDASTAVSKFDGRIHFNDKFKTPFHQTFSNESQYATAEAPHWEGDKLIDNQGNVVADETPPKKGKPVPGFVESSKNAIVNPAAGVVPAAPKATIVQDPIVTRSIAKNIADQSAAVPALAPAPAQTQVTQPDSNDDYNKLMDSVFPSAKTAEAAGDIGSVGTLEADDKNHVNPISLLSYLQNKFANSDLVKNHYIPPDGARWGIKTGSASEWAAFGLAVARQESGFNTTSYNPNDPGGSAGIFQFGQGQTQYTKGSNQFNPQESADAFVRSVEHYVNGGRIANMGETFGSIRRPNEAGQYIPWAQSVAANAPAQGATAASVQNKMPWDDWAKLSPADQAAAEKEGQDFRTQQVSVLDKLNQSTPNPKQFWEKLQSPIEGVTDAQRQAYADNFKKEVTAHAQDFYGEKDPEKAFTKAVSDPGFDAYITNIGRGLAGAVGQADIGIALAGKSIDRNRVDGFMNLVHPDSSGEGRAGFVKALTDIQDKKQRHDVFNEIYGSLPQNTKDAIGDPASILDSIDHLANPAEQADLNKRIAVKKAWVDQQLAGSPELKGTSAGWWTTGTGENLFNTVAALVPGGVGAVVRTSTLGAQMYSSNMDRITQEHPDWSPDKVSEEASKSAFMTLAPQEAVLAASHGLTAPLLKWAGALAEKPIVRFGIGGGVQVAAAGAGGALGQVGANVAENKPLLQDVPQAAGSAIVQSLPFAVHGGLGALGHEVAPVEPARTEPTPAEPAPSRPVTASEMLGPDVAEAPSIRRPRTAEEEAYNKWYPDKTVEPGQDPLVIRGAERTTWSPQELADLIDRSPNSVARLRSPTGLHLGDEGTLEAEQTRQMRVNQPPITPTELLTRRTPVDLNTEIARQRAAASLGETPSTAPRPADTQPLGNAQIKVRNNATGKTDAVLIAKGGPRDQLPYQVHGPFPMEGHTAHAPGDMHGFNTDAEVYRAIKAAADKHGWTIESDPRYKYAEPWLNKFSGKAQGKTFSTPAHVDVYNDLVARGMDEARARDYVSKAKGATQAEILADVQTQMRGRGEQPPPQPGKISGEEPGIQREADKSTSHAVKGELTKGVANKYAEERMKAGELEPIDPNTGLTTEELMARALKMRPQEVQDHINNFMENRGGDPRDHAAAVRRQENFLTDRNRALSLKADSNPHDVQARAEAVSARKALNDFYTKGGPISRMKELFHVHGKGLQGEPSIDLSTEGGLHDKFLRETNRPPPPGAKPRLAKAAERVRTTHSDEYKARDKVDKAIDKDGRKKIPSIEEVRDHIAKRMTQMPCRK